MNRFATVHETVDDSLCSPACLGGTGTALRTGWSCLIAHRPGKGKGSHESAPVVGWEDGKSPSAGWSSGGSVEE